MSRRLTAKLNLGTYIDHGQNNGTGQKTFEGGPATPPYGDGVWTFSPPFTHLVHFAGVPHVVVKTSAPADRGNLVVDVYDIDTKGNALLISRARKPNEGGSGNAVSAVEPTIRTPGQSIHEVVTGLESEAIKLHDGRSVGAIVSVFVRKK